MTHLMKQNIHTLIQIPISQPFFQDNLSQHLEKSDEIQNQHRMIRRNLQNASKRFQNIGILSPQMLKYYQLQEDLLANCEISQGHRAKMRLWISANCYIRRLSFQTASLACYILDLYFSKGGQCILEDFQYLGICCFRIANKMEDNYLIPIDYDIFKKDKLIQMEASICIRTGFELNPITFTEISHSLYYFWTIFRTKVKDEGLNGLTAGLKFEDRVKVLEIEFAFTLLHEFLELAFLVLKTFKFGLDVVVSNAFFLILCLQFDDWDQTISAAQMKQFIRKYLGQSSVWDCFEKFCLEIGSKIKIGYLENCTKFLFPIYNSLITEGKNSKDQKNQETVLKPNQEKFRLSSGHMIQSNHFKDKLNSLRRCNRRQKSEKVRKCSEATDI